MRILAIETATPASSVALGDDASLVAMSVRVDGRGHVGFLVPAIDFCFTQAGWTPHDLDLVAVDIGPGPYTGIRAGIATAQAIAAAVGVRVVTVSSLTVIALRAATGRRLIWPVVDVRRGQVATAPFSPVPGGVVRDGDSEIVTPEQFIAMVEASPEDVLVVGDWPALPEGVLKSAHRAKVGRPRYPAADTMLEIAVMKANHEEFAQATEIRPLYMREPDASINWSDFREEGLWPGAAG
ncbi:MAG TPA: tRNA (adenosine(37)-N6)-threonylcarbamoyltransferase complex dimerization subunit type 1 TsaB [Acidimicrobiia bacterium]|jgi:tRNA threonylcarbamoyladenosine biosynthesis protein TsaB